MPAHASVREVAVHISNHTMRRGDRGVVVIGGSLELGDIASHAASGFYYSDLRLNNGLILFLFLPYSFLVSPGQAALQKFYNHGTFIAGDEDPLAAELAAEALTHDGLSKKFGHDVEDTDATSRLVDVSRHFSYYAVDGGTGAERWRHEVCLFEILEFKEYFNLL